MKLLLMVFMSSFFIGCSSFAEPHNYVELLTIKLRPNHVDPELERYVLDFEKEYRVTVNIYVGMESNLDNNYIGECWRFEDGYKEVVIEKEWWNKATILRRRSLVFHELAHCLFGRKHIEGKFKDGCPISLMSKNIESQQCLRRHWNEYKKELLIGK